ncbi:OmpA family protein [Dactylosporangium aurantiacum]|uniref:OmpA family protein n=1 Tax=Dactylosporangium aurantiacum TaxID=35754 RepID=A0A9Q9IPM9_9ACTN|nr:OmpA family protein [Dactylosporangium aurantiacum]MDG6103065.1 OmpA family protein [Dactylosporangium aurantiacum]UWZ57577.1 OmpA family protein [Dactylosporangium aurantiacum]
MRRVRSHPGAWLPVMIVGALLLTGCGGDEPSAAPASAGAAPTAEASTGAPAEEPPASLPPGAQPGLDDYDGDGQKDPTCSTQDFGAGLVLRIPCQISNAHDPENDTRLVKDSLYRLPGPDVDLTGVSGSVLEARDPDGGHVYIVTFNSDALFATGSAEIGSTDTLDNTIKVINKLYPNGAIQVRGHTDATGSASGNQALSQRRAETVRAYLTGHGVAATAVTAVGLGSSRPLVEERNTDGSASVAGRAFNRRVELVIRLPK